MKHQHNLKPIYVCMLLALAVQSAAANPLDPLVVNGQASFATTGNTLTVTNTPGTIINWQGFSIGSNEITRFAQQSASSAVLNRVISGNPSSILGSLLSNGIVFGAGSTINVAGLVATTLNLSNADFLAGRNNFTQVPGAQNLSNAGNITAQGDGQSGGQIFLIAPNVENTGVITAPNGEILLAAGHSVELVNSNDPSLRVSITAAAGDATNVGQLVASAGKLGLFGTVVRNSGIVSADSAVMQGGKIVLKASLRAEVGGTVSANGTSGGSVDISAAHSLDPNAPGVVIQTGSIQAQGIAGTGGAVSLNADSILSAAAINADGATAGGTINVQATDRALSTSFAQYSASSTQGQGGDILVSANVSNYTSGSYSATGLIGGNITLAGNEIKLAGAQLDASGSNGGGTIHVGGLMHGAAGFGAQGVALNNASNVLTNSSTRFKADALQIGNGGQVVLWSDQAMRFKGDISAKGGASSGNGGMAEVSGLTSLGYGGLVNLSAQAGLNGTLLLDPRNITIVPGAGGLVSVSSPSVLELIDPTPGAGEGFGSMMTELINGNIVIASPNDGLAAANAGAVYMYSATGTLFSTLVGSMINDRVGSGGVTKLTGNGNFLVRSPLWNNGAATTAGAVTWVSGTAGVSGVVSAGNSLVGSHTGDGVGQALFVPYRDNPGLVALSNGNYVVVSSEWNFGRGAVTWGNGASGTAGVVSQTSNSLAGSGTGSFVGAGGISLLSNGNYAVQSPWFDYYDSSVATWLNDPGAVTWMNGANGLLSDGASFGVVSASNSLLGKFDYDNVAAIRPLANGNFLATTPVWGGGLFGGGNGKGAVTWLNGQTGTLMGGATGGVVSSANSLVYSRTGDMAGSAITELGNGNYVVSSPGWDNGAVNIDAGAVTWGSGTAGVSGVVSSANSLVGVASGDQVGWQILALPVNGNYVVSGLSAGNPTATWVNGANGQTADATHTISVANSLMGAGNTYALTNGNYVVVNGYYAGGGSQRGVATWVRGTNGLTSDGSNVISISNSIIGQTNNDMIGQNGVITLSNGNYVLQNFNWNYAPGGGIGAVTWVNGATGQTNNASNIISQFNSVVGNSTGEQVGARVVLLTNNNYVIGSYNWRGPEAGYRTSTGAATWVNGATGLTSNSSGMISQANSLLGFNTSDRVGYNITALSNGNYVVGSPFWGGNKGAVTWGNGLGGTVTSSVGFVSASNSLVGSLASDYVGASSSMGGNTISALSNGNFIFGSAYWNSMTGAVTWGNGATAGPRTVGAISSANSITGSAPGQYLGYAAMLGNGNYVVNNSSWNGYRGAVTWVNGGNGQVSDYVANGNTNIVSAANSLVGSTVNDYVGSGGIIELGNGNYAVSSSAWNNGAMTAAGAVTWANSLGTTAGVVSASNSLVGSAINEGLGSYVVRLNGAANLGNAYVGSSAATSGAGRAFIMSALAGPLFTDTPATDMTIGAGNIAATLNAGTNVVLQANNDITQQAGAGITATGLGNLTMQAGRSVVLNDMINIAGVLDITSNDPGAIAANRAAGAAVLDISLATLTAGQINLANSGGNILAGAVSANILVLNSGTWNQVAAVLPTFNVNDFRIAGGTFIRALGGDGSIATPYQLADIFGVQGMGSAGMLGNAYVLANNIDATGTVNWNWGSGFAPVGTGYPGVAFSGRFDGLGHTISNLTINRSSYNVGLFGYTGWSANIRNVGLVGGSVGGGSTVGGLVGYNNGTIINSYNTGSVNTVFCDCYSYEIGGLVGYNGGTISNSYASSDVTATSSPKVGGLVGRNYFGTISTSYATGSVAGTSYVGGLVGYNYNDGGPLIADAYATGSVTGNNYVGGLVGYNYSGDISTSYASGSVTGVSFVGGLVGINAYGYGTIIDSFWNLDTSGQTTSDGGTGMSNAGMMQLATFSNWNIANTGGAGMVWRIYEGQTAPLLANFLTSLAVTASAASKTYDGLAFSGGNGVAYSVAGAASAVFGTPVYGGTSQGAVDAGKYSLDVSGLYSDQQGYDISFANGALTVLGIPPAPSAVPSITPNVLYAVTNLPNVDFTSELPAVTMNSVNMTLALNPSGAGESGNPEEEQISPNNVCR